MVAKQEEQQRSAQKDYDVFLSHSNEDKISVEVLARQLRKKARLKPFLDKWHLVPGEPWQEALEAALKNSRTCAIFVGPNGFRPWHHEEMRAAIQLRVSSDKFRVIPVLLPGARPPLQDDLPLFLSGLSWVDFRGSDGIANTEEFSRLIAGIRGLHPGENGMKARKKGNHKQKPYHDKQSNVASDSNGVTRIILTIDMELEQYDARNKRLLQHALAGFLEISPDAVKITSTERANSVKVTVELPTQSAEKLLQSYTDNDPSLSHALKKFPLLDVYADETPQLREKSLLQSSRTVLLSPETEEPGIKTHIINQPPATILIVDDEPNNVDYVGQELEDQGYRVISATNAEDALAKAVNYSPTVILLDVIMPEVDGFSVCRTLKKQKETQLIPVIIMTALEARADRIKGIEAGADDFLTKPIDDRELIARVRSAVRLKQVSDRKVRDDTAPNQLFHQEGEFWTIAYKGKVVRVKDSKGLRHIADLLRNPHRAIPVTSLEAPSIEPGNLDTFPKARSRSDLGEAGEILDAKAKATYRQRMSELQEALAEAKRLNPQQAKRIEQEIDDLYQGLRHAVAFGGRKRVSGSLIERARVNVKRAIDAAIDKLETLHPELWQHLRRTIKTGTSCTYAPDLNFPSSWEA